MTRVLDDGQPFIRSFDLDSDSVGGRITVQGLTRSNEVVVDLEPLEDRRVLPLEPAHDLLAVSDFAVHPLHPVVVNRPVEDYEVRKSGPVVLVVPKKVRENLNIKSGTRLQVEIEGERLIYSPIPKDND